MIGCTRIVVVFVVCVLAVTIAAPVQDESKETPEGISLTKLTDTSDTVKEPEPEVVNNDEDKTSQETKEGAVSVEDVKETEGSGAPLEEDDVTPNKEIINYKDIQVDDDSDVINGNNEVGYEGVFDDGYNDYQLTEEDAIQLLQELSDPAQVALFVMQTDDVTGFLTAVGMLLQQGYISEEYAYFLKDAVSQDLDQLLMLQDQEFYGEPIDVEPVDEMGADYVEDMLNRPVPYIPQDYFDVNMPYEEPNPYLGTDDYGMDQEDYPEETIALAEIANIIADQIENGEMSSARGERIIDILSQLLPESFWGEGSISDEMMEDMSEAYSKLYQEVPMGGPEYPMERYPFPIGEEDDYLGPIEGDQYKTYETERDEPIPGGERHFEEEVVVDETGRPIGKVMRTEEEAEEVLGDDDVGDVEEELEEQLQDIEPVEVEPETPDDIEQALQDVEDLATAEEDAMKDEEEAELEEMEETEDDADSPGWRELVLLLDQGKISDELLKELGISSDDLDSTKSQLDQLREIKP